MTKVRSISQLTLMTTSQTLLAAHFHVWSFSFSDLPYFLCLLLCICERLCVPYDYHMVVWQGSRTLPCSSPVLRSPELGPVLQMESHEHRLEKTKSFHPASASWSAIGLGCQQAALLPRNQLWALQSRALSCRAAAYGLEWGHSLPGAHGAWLLLNFLRFLSTCSSNPKILWKTILQM